MRDNFANPFISSGSFIGQPIDSLECYYCKWIRKARFSLKPTEVLDIASKIPHCEVLIVDEVGKIHMPYGICKSWIREV